MKRAFIDSSNRKGVRALSNRMPQHGEAVVYVDSVCQAHPALVTAVWGEKGVNVVFVSRDVNKTDHFGRQIERNTSCLHQTLQPAAGNYWRYVDDAPKATEVAP